jgi:uncharacterized protein YceK
MCQINLPRLCTVLTLILCVFLAGCGSVVNQSNYDKIQTGMSLSQVEAILGKGKEQSSAGGSFGGVTMSSKSVVWQDGNRVIAVVFMNNEVASKSQMGF